MRDTIFVRDKTFAFYFTPTIECFGSPAGRDGGGVGVGSGLVPVRFREVPGIDDGGSRW